MKKAKAKMVKTVKRRMSASLAPVEHPRLALVQVHTLDKPGHWQTADLLLSRVPCVDEYVSAPSTGQRRVRLVVHRSAHSTHDAEVWAGPLQDEREAGAMIDSIGRGK